MGCYIKPSITKKRDERRPTLKEPLRDSNMSTGGYKPKPTSERPPTPPPQGKSGWQEKMQNYLGKQRRASFDTLISSITSLFEENESLKQKLADYSKDEEIQKVKDELAQLRANTFLIMSDSEKEDAKRFREEHYESCKSNVHYRIEHTGVGTGIQITCNKCKTTENITDYDRW